MQYVVKNEDTLGVIENPSQQFPMMRVIASQAGGKSGLVGTFGASIRKAKPSDFERFHCEVPQALCGVQA